MTTFSNSAALFSDDVPPRYRELCDAVNVAFLAYRVSNGKTGLDPEMHYRPVWNAKRDAWDVEFWRNDYRMAKANGAVVTMTDKTVLASAPKQSDYGEGIAS
jgi:hypothetical protein